MRIVLAKTQATAPQALPRSSSGKSWTAVAKKYSTDPTTKNNGGLLQNVSKGQQDAALSSAAFSAPLNKLVGPVKGSVRLLRRRGDQGHPGHAAVAGHGDAADQADAHQPEPERRRERVNTKAKKDCYSARTLCSKLLRDRRLQRLQEAESGEHAGVRRDRAVDDAGAKRLDGHLPIEHAHGHERLDRDVHDLEVTEAARALQRLDAITHRLRRDCPWDREQDERSIVPHTVEEAYELADAARAGDDAKLLDELGDVLFQVHFLAMLLDERGAGDLAAVAEHVTEKLIRRHPHVFGETEAATAGEVLRNWDRIKQDEAGREPGIFGEVPENLPGPLYARKVQRRAATSGFDFPAAGDAGQPVDALRASRGGGRGAGRRRS